MLARFWSECGNPNWAEQRRRFLDLLAQQAALERMARIVGKDALPPRQQHVLLCAELINEAFLRQSAYSEIDRYCSAARQLAMMRTLNHFIDLSEAALAQRASVEAIGQLPVMRDLRRMGEDIGDDRLEQFEELQRRLDAAITELTRRNAADAR